MRACDGFRWVSEPWGPALRSVSLLAVARHLFSARQLRFRGPGEAADWADVAASLGVPADRLLRLKQVHGNAVAVPTAGEGSEVGGALPEADILASDDSSLALAVQVADCVPLLLADPRTGAVAAAHAGWRGTAANVAGTAVATLAERFGARPEDLVVAHGPSIGPCCYTVGEELRGVFQDAGFGPALDRWFRCLDGGWRLDLWTANADQLAAAGVRRGAISLAGLCTACRPDRFHSYRREGPGTGRIAAAIRPGRPLRP